MPVASSNSPGPRSIIAHLTCEWRLKAMLYAVLTLAFGVPYLLLQRYPVLTPGRFELGTLDRWIGFSPAWLWVYQSAYLLIPIAPLLSRNRGELAVYARGFLIMTAVAIGFFVLMPIEAPRPLDVPRDGLWALLLSYDRTINTFPSLHVAMVTQSLCFAAWLAGARRARGVTLAMAGGIAWAALICYSTVATKQHYAIDVPGGLVLGWLSHCCAVRVWRAVPKIIGEHVRIS